MTDEHFWTLIDQARANSPASATPKSMTAILTPLSDEEVTSFGTLFFEKVCDLNNWSLWGAGHVITGGMGDDSFHYFRTWIVGKGREVFELALKNPDDLGPYVDDPDVDNESLEYVTIYLLKSRGSDIDPRDLASRSAESHATQGEPFDEDTVHASFPKLAAQFG